MPLQTKDLMKFSSDLKFGSILKEINKVSADATIAASFFDLSNNQQQLWLFILIEFILSRSMGMEDQRNNNNRF